MHLCCRNSNDSVVRALVDGQRMTFLSLAGGNLTPAEGSFTYRGIHAFLTRRAANALNQAFATGFFQDGTRLGKLRIQVTLAG